MQKTYLAPSIIHFFYEKINRIRASFIILEKNLHLTLKNNRILLTLRRFCAILQKENTKKRRRSPWSTLRLLRPATFAQARRTAAAASARPLASLLARPAAASLTSSARARSNASEKCRRIRRLFLLLALLGALALLVSDAAAGLASRLAGSLALAASAVLCAVAKILGFDGLYSFHFEPPK